MTKGAASKVISRLEQKGLAQRRAMDRGGREQILSLTSAGKKLVPQLTALADANDTHFFDHLLEADRAKLMSLMQALVKHHQLNEIPTA